MYPKSLDEKNEKSFFNYIKSLPFFESSILLNSKKYRHDIRFLFSKSLLHGNGLEIGPGSFPLLLKEENPRPKYMDYADKEELALKFGVDKDYINCDIVGSIENIPVSHESFDFVASSHVLEHSLDPIQSIQECLRVVKLNGSIFVAVPNMKSSMFDFKRKMISINDLCKVHNYSPQEKKVWLINRYREFVSNTRISYEDNNELHSKIVSQFINEDRRIHFYPYGPRLLIDLINISARQCNYGIKLIDSYYHSFSNDIIVVFKKVSNSTTNFKKIEYSSILDNVKSSRQILFKIINEKCSKKVPIEYQDIYLK